MIIDFNNPEKKILNRRTEDIRNGKYNYKGKVVKLLKPFDQWMQIPNKTVNDILNKHGIYGDFSLIVSDENNNSYISFTKNEDLDYLWRLLAESKKREEEKGKFIVRDEYSFYQSKGNEQISLLLVADGNERQLMIALSNLVFHFFAANRIANNGEFDYDIQFSGNFYHKLRQMAEGQQPTTNK